MNAKPVFRKNSEIKVRSGVARQILKPSEDNPLRPDAYGELRYELEGDTVFFTFNAQGLEAGNYYGLYSGDRLLGLGYAVKSLTQVILRQPKTDAQMAVHAEVIARHDLDAHQHAIGRFDQRRGANSIAARAGYADGQGFRLGLRQGHHRNAGGDHDCRQ